MSEDFGVVRTKATAATSSAIVAAIAACVDGTGHWQTDPDITVGADQKVFRPVVQDGAPAASQRIVIDGSAGGGVIRVGYAPENGLPLILSDLPTSPPNCWTGLRSITGTTASVGSVDRVWVAEYRDDDAGGVNPASSMAILLSLGAAFTFGALVGRVIACDNESDEQNGTFGDALLTGVPRASSTTDSGTWSLGEFVSPLRSEDSSIVRTGARSWGYARITENFAAGKRADLEGARRLVPYAHYTIGRAVLGAQNSTTNGGIIGSNKYLRMGRETLNWVSRWQSGTAGSEQAWRPMVTTVGGSTATALLWAKTVTEVA